MTEPLETARDNHFDDDPVSIALTKRIKGMKPGDRLPSERDLATELGVSRTALRDRLAVLVGLGSLERQIGSGTYVAELRPQTLALALSLGLSSANLPIHALESVRIALERQAAIEACAEPDLTLTGHMQQALDVMSVATTSVEMHQADREFHQAMLRVSGNPALIFFADVLADTLSQSMAERSVRLREKHTEEGLRDLFVELHTPIYEAIMSGDEERAVLAVEEHFDIVMLY